MERATERLYTDNDDGENPKTMKDLRQEAKKDNKDKAIVDRPQSIFFQSSDSSS